MRFLFDGHVLDTERRELFRGDSQIALQPQVFDLLVHLVQNRDRVIPREEILQKVWQYHGSVSSRTLDVHIAWLRQKLDNPHNPQHIQTIRGRGYRFKA